MLEYGDSRDSYFVNQSQYESESGVARQYARQKVWPRAIYVRRARFGNISYSLQNLTPCFRYYHSARLRWNSIERRRSSLEDSLIDDLVEWSLWHYPIGQHDLTYHTNIAHPS
jgi:proteasome activator subunit 4